MTTMQISRWFESLGKMTRVEVRLAWAIALAADSLQIVVFFLFAAGGISPADSLLDLIVATVLTR
jgi:hypothetical protein